MDTLPFIKTVAALASAATLGFGIHYVSHPKPSLVKKSETTAPAASFAPLDELLQEKRTPERDRKLRYLIERIADRDIPTAMRRLKDVRGDWAIYNVQLELLARWAAIDPKSAIAWQPRGGEPARIEAILIAASTWAEKDEAGALAWLESLPNSASRQAALLGVLGSIASRDPGRAITLLLSRPKLADDEGWSIVFTKIANRSPQLALAEAFKIPEGRNRTEALKSIAVLMGASDPKGAENWIRQLPPGNARKEAMQGLIQMLVYEDPKEAIRISLNEKAAGRSQVGDLLQAIEQWAQRDIDSARAWIDELPHGSKRSDATLALAMTWSERNPEAAIEYALASPDGPAKVKNTGAVLSQWLSDDFPGGMAWISSRAGQIPTATLQHAASYLTWRSPADAAILLEHLPDGDQRSQIYQRLASSWTKNHPEAAAAWLEKIPEGAGKEAFTTGFIRTAAATDLPAAIKAFETLPAGSARNETAATIATSWAKTDPQGALQWVEKPGSTRPLEGAARELAVKQVIALWSKQDAAAAKAWLQSSSLPEAQKQSLLKN